MWIPFAIEHMFHVSEVSQSHLHCWHYGIDEQFGVATPNREWLTAAIFFARGRFNDAAGATTPGQSADVRDHRLSDSAAAAQQPAPAAISARKRWRRVSLFLIANPMSEKRAYFILNVENFDALLCQLGVAANQIWRLNQHFLDQLMWLKGA